jgi:glycoside/pentoside/hexuronide:cation symporter, GPH family
MKSRIYLGWAVGSFMSSALVSSVGLLHLRFMTDSLGIDIRLAGMLAVIAKLYDAFTDPVMGVLSDKTRTRFGRYRPYLFLGALLGGLSMAALFNVPSSLGATGTVVFVAFTLFLYSTAYTIFRIPYLALGRGLTQEFTERSWLMTFSVYGSSIGALAATAATPFFLSVVGSDRAGHGQVALILGMFITLTGLASFFLLQESRVHTEHELPQKPKMTVAKTLSALRRNQPFLCLIAFKVTMFSGLTLHMSAIPYYTRHVMHVSDGVLGSVFLAQTLTMMLCQPFWVAMAKRLGRRNGLAIAALVSGTAMVGWYLAPHDQATPWVQLLGVLSGIGGGGVFLGLYTALNDSMDYSRTEQGDDVTGILAGIFVMVEKGTAAFGMFLISLILGNAGFVSGTGSEIVQQSKGALVGITTSLSVVPAILVFAASLFLLGVRFNSEAKTEKASG